MESASQFQLQRERRRTMDNRYAACHADTLGNLHIVNQLQPNLRRPARPISQPTQTPLLRSRSRVKTVRFSLENYANSARSSANKPLPSFFQLGLNEDDDNKPKPLPKIPASSKLPLPQLQIPGKPPPPPKDHHVAEVLECKRVSIQRLKTPKPQRLISPRVLMTNPILEEEQQEDVVAIVKVYRPPRRIRIHWLRVLKDQQRKWAFPIVLILVPTKKGVMPNRISKVLVVGQGRRPGTYERPMDIDDHQGGRQRRLTTMTMQTDDMTFSRRPKSTPAHAYRRPSTWMPVLEDTAPRRVSTPDLPHPGTKWME